MIAAFVLAATLGAGPTPTPPPEIIHTSTSPQCTELKNLLLPVGYTTKRNDSAFVAMAESTRKFFSNIYPADVPTWYELQNVVNGQPTDIGAKTTEAMGNEDIDDQLLYSPGQVLDAARIEAVAEQIYTNIGVELSIMKQSWKDYPQGSDPKVDEMRQHAQNLIDLQRALADRYEQFAGNYLTNQGMAALQDPNSRATFKLYLRALLLGQAPLTGDENGEDTTNDGYVSQSERARLGNIAQVVSGLHQEEHTFAPKLLATINHCQGTDYTIQH